jgi:cyclic pyranopterin phosphate synthase
VEREEVLTFEEIDRLVGVAVGLGWRKVRLTGGEPLVRRNCVDLVHRLARHKEGPPRTNRLEVLAMTSNGILLSRFARDLKAAGLDRVNVSLDTLDPERFRKITGYDKLAEVREGIRAAVDAGLVPLKINTVLIRGGTEDEFYDFVNLARTEPMDIRFIEFMPFAGNGWNRDQVLLSDDLKARLGDRFDLFPVKPAAHPGPAKTFSAPGWRGTVSFISPMSDRAFCGACNRVRMTSEGKLRGCLLNENEMDFRDAIRNGAGDADLAALFRHAIAVKPEEHPFHQSMERGEAVGPEAGRGMHRIGG